MGIENAFIAASGLIIVDTMIVYTTTMTDSPLSPLHAHNIRRLALVLCTHQQKGGGMPVQHCRFGAQQLPIDAHGDVVRVAPPRSTAAAVKHMLTLARQGNPHIPRHNDSTRCSVVLQPWLSPRRRGDPVRWL